jgi:flagellar biogenesis protein FliO
MDWMKILSAVAIIAMMVLIWPSVKHATQNAPKGSMKDWMAFIKPMLLVIGFIILLIMLVR